MPRKKIHKCRCVDCRRTDSQTRDYHQSINRVIVELDERSRRLFAGLLARQLGHGGIVQVHRITGLSRVTIRRGRRECETGQSIAKDRVRQVGGGRHSVEKKMHALLIGLKNF